MQLSMMCCLALCCWPFGARQWLYRKGSETVKGFMMNTVFVLQVSATTSPGALAASARTEQPKGLLIQAAAANTAAVKVGNATNQYFELAAGQAVSLPFVDPSTIYVTAVSGTQTVNVIGVE